MDFRGLEGSSERAGSRGALTWNPPLTHFPVVNSTCSDFNHGSALHIAASNLCLGRGQVFAGTQHNPALVLPPGPVLLPSFSFLPNPFPASRPLQRMGGQDHLPFLALSFPIGPVGPLTWYHRSPSSVFVLPWPHFWVWGLGPEGMTYTTEVGRSFPVGSMTSPGWGLRGGLPWGRDLNLNAPSLPVAMLAQGMTLLPSLLHLDPGSLGAWPQWEGSLPLLSFLPHLFLLVHRTERDKCQQRWSQTPHGHVPGQGRGSTGGQELRTLLEEAVPLSSPSPRSHYPTMTTSQAISCSAHWACAWETACYWMARRSGTRAGRGGAGLSAQSWGLGQSPDCVPSVCPPSRACTQRLFHPTVVLLEPPLCPTLG